MTFFDRLKDQSDQEKQSEEENRRKEAEEREEARKADLRLRMRLHDEMRENSKVKWERLRLAAIRLNFKDWVTKTSKALGLDKIRIAPELVVNSNKRPDYLWGTLHFIGKSFLIAAKASEGLHIITNSFLDFYLFEEDENIVVHIGATRFTEEEFLNAEDKVLEAVLEARRNPRMERHEEDWESVNYDGLNG